MEAPCFPELGHAVSVPTNRPRQICRLIVLDNLENKQLRGVISLGDIVRQKEEKVAADALTGIAAEAA